MSPNYAVHALSKMFMLLPCLRVTHQYVILENTFHGSSYSISSVYALNMYNSICTVIRNYAIGCKFPFACVHFSTGVSF